MHWADVIANKLIEKGKKHVLATGITPSGPIHVGNMREVITTDAVYRALIEKDAEPEFIYIADDYDHLRKLYPFLSDSFKNYIGKPISEIPCICGKHKSYADHYLNSFLSSLKKLGINPKVIRASDLYKKGEYNNSIQIALKNTEKIKNIIQQISKRELPKNWIPFNVKCINCGKITSTKPILYEYPNIEYKCDCGYEDSADIREGGVGKLPWRIDWPARWEMLGITFEPFGKDLGTVGGARQTGEIIVKDIFKFSPPDYTVYEFILLKGKGAMHSSKGTALSSEEMLAMTPPEVLRFLIVKNQPNKHIVFDPGFGLLNLVDEYDHFERIFFGKEDRLKGMKDIENIYELSQPYKISNKIPFQIPYRHLVTIVQISEEWKDIKNILLRTKQIPENIEKNDEENIKQRINHVKYWLKKFAPNKLKFEIQNKIPDIKLSEKQKNIIEVLIEKFDSIEWEPNALHNSIYAASENEEVSIKTLFSTLYQIILGQNEGPRAGYFISNLDKNFVMKRLKEAIKL
jgi:lysyl-tRNA synthetase class 1